MRRMTANAEQNWQEHFSIGRRHLLVIVPHGARPISLRQRSSLVGVELIGRPRRASVERHGHCRFPGKGVHVCMRQPLLVQTEI